MTALENWQAAQAAVCGCRGSDDLCACQNEKAPWKYGLAPRPTPPFGAIRSPMRDYHEVTYNFPSLAAAQQFREQVQRLWQPPTQQTVALDPGSPKNQFGDH